MKFLSKKTTRTALSLLFFFIIIIFIDISGITHSRLKIHTPIKADLLILEGWIHPYFYKHVVAHFDNNNYDRILITGSRITRSIQLNREGSIIIKDVNNLNPVSLKKIKAVIHGTYANGSYSNCLIFKNDSLVSSGKYRGDSTVSFNCHLNESDSLVFMFNNDYMDKNNDRNLTIKKVKINNEKVKLFSNMVWIDSHYNYSSSEYYLNSKVAVEELVSMGIPPDKIDCVIDNNRKISRTYGSALHVGKWMKENNYNKANIISMSFHTKRSLLSFKKANPNMEFGIISIDYYSRKFRTIKEIIGNILIRISPKFILEMNVKR